MILFISFLFFLYLQLLFLILRIILSKYLKEYKVSSKPKRPPSKQLKTKPIFNPTNFSTQIKLMSNSTSGSKSKNKQKKSEQVIELERKVQNLTRQNIELSLTIKKLNDRTIELKLIQGVQQSMHKQSTIKVSEQIQKLELINLAKDEHIKALRQKKQEYEIQNGCLSYKLQRLGKDFEQYRTISQQQYDDLKRQSQTQIKKYQTIVNEYQMAINQRLQYLSLNQKLQNQLDKNLDHQKRQMADKDRDKLQTIDFLKKQMHQETKQLKSNLLSMRRDQMATNTRLTVLQNHQLLEELQYQSKNTEKVLKRNAQLQKKVQQLSKQLQVEKQIMEELAKRSTIAKKIIKNINQKNISLQKQLQQLNTKTQASLKKPQNQKIQLNQQSSSTEQRLKSYVQTVKLLESEVIQYQQRLKKLEEQKNHFQQLYETNQPKFQYYLRTQDDLRLLMIKFLTDTLEGKVIGQQNSVEYDISRLKDVHIDQWTRNDIEITMKMLLTFIKPHFTITNMKAQFLRYKKWNVTPKDSIDELIKRQDDTNYTTQSIVHQNKSKHIKMKSLSSVGLNYGKSNLQKGHTSTNISPRKQFSLHSVLQDYKNKCAKTKKSQSQHNLNMSVDNKFISGQQQSFKPYNVKQNYRNGFHPQTFKNKESKKLVRTNIREWGRKIQMQSRASMIGKGS